MAHYLCVIFDDLTRARGAYRALAESELSLDMDNVHLHYRELREDKLPWSQTRSRGWAGWSGLAGAVIGAVLGAIAWSFGVLEEIPMYAVVLISALLCGMFGALGATLLGGTLPGKPLADAAPMLEPGHVAIVAEFDHEQQTRDAETLLMAHGGVVCQKPESVLGHRLAS